MSEPFARRAARESECEYDEDEALDEGPEASAAATRPQTTEDGRSVQGKLHTYEIETTRGSGGFGTTYVARMLDTGTRVLLKELSLERAASWKSVELFQREAQTLAALSHPGVPRFVESFAKGVDDPSERIRYFLVQELIEGETLAERLESQGPLGPEAASKLLHELLDVLAALHRSSPPIVHRDVTPANIVLGRDGHARLVDFGAVQRKDVAAPAGSTMTGTAGYMPMEQIVGQAAPATDLYALGMSLVFALTGREPSELPFDPHTARLNVDAVLPVLPDASAPLARALRGMVEPTIGTRLPSVDAVRAALEPAAPQGRAAKWSAATFAFVSVGILALALAATSVTLMVRAVTSPATSTGTGAPTITPVAGLRSLDTRLPVHVDFVNRLPGRVRILWIDYEGQERSYPDSELAPGAMWSVNTYVHHPFIARDVATGAVVFMFMASDQVARTVDIAAAKP